MWNEHVIACQLVRPVDRVTFSGKKNVILNSETLHRGRNMSLGQIFDREFHLGCSDIKPRPPASARVMKDACCNYSRYWFSNLNRKENYTVRMLLFPKVILKRTRL